MYSRGEDPYIYGLGFMYMHAINYSIIINIIATASISRRQSLMSECDHLPIRKERRRPLVSLCMIDEANSGSKCLVTVGA